MRFTTENAREYSARGNAIRWSREKSQALLECPIANPAANPEQSPEQPAAISLACVRERLEALDQRMAKAQTDREWDNLSRAYERMFKVWCVLTRTPGPGQLKPQATRAPRRAYAQAPLPQGWESTPDATKVEQPNAEQPNATQPNVAPKAPEASQ